MHWNIELRNQKKKRLIQGRFPEWQRPLLVGEHQETSGEGQETGKAAWVPSGRHKGHGGVFQVDIEKILHSL